MEERDPVPFDQRAKNLAETVAAERKIKSDQKFAPEMTREELIAGAYLRLLRATGSKTDVNVIGLGNGAFVVNHGYYGEDAALFIEPVSERGQIGADASESGLSKTECVEGGTVITFSNLASADVVREALMNAYHDIGKRRLVRNDS